MATWWMVIGTAVTLGIAVHMCRWAASRRRAHRREELLLQYAPPGPSRRWED